jgi:hypothetical protein
VKFSGAGKFIPSVLSVSVILALYVAQFLMLGGNLYQYHENPAVTIFLRIMIAAIPTVSIYFLHKKSGITPPSPHPSSSQ